MILRLDIDCKQCGSHTYETRYKKPHVGLYCKCCGKYIKWLSSKEKKEYGVVTSEDLNEPDVREAKQLSIDDYYEPNGLDEVPWYD